MLGPYASIEDQYDECGYCPDCGAFDDGCDCNCDKCEICGRPFSQHKDCPPGVCIQCDDDNSDKSAQLAMQALDDELDDLIDSEMADSDPVKGCAGCGHMLPESYFDTEDKCYLCDDLPLDV